MEDVQRLIKSRAGHRGNITTLINSIKNFLGTFDDSKRSELIGLRVVLTERYSKLQELDELIFNTLVDDEATTQDRLELEARSSSEIAVRVQTKLCRSQEVLDQLEERRSPSRDVDVRSSSSFSERARGMQARVKLR